MPTCRSCGRYYSIHAMWCPQCHPVAPAAISAASELPSVGDTYHDPEAGDTHAIVSVARAGSVVVLGLADGSTVEIESSELVPLSTP